MRRLEKKRKRKKYKESSSERKECKEKKKNKRTENKWIIQAMLEVWRLKYGLHTERGVKK